MSDSLEGHWEGLMHDAEGFSARVELHLDAKGRGKFSFWRTGDHCGGEERSGEVEVKAGREGEVTMAIGKGELPPIRFEGRRTPVKTHARACIVGTYTQPESHERGGTGVAIFWLYADKG